MKVHDIVDQLLEDADSMVGDLRLRVILSTLIETLYTHTPNWSVWEPVPFPAERLELLRTALRTAIFDKIPTGELTD